jgi:hypothetical protein
VQTQTKQRIKVARLTVEYEDGHEESFEWASEVHPVNLDILVHSGFPQVQSGEVEITFSRWPRGSTFVPAMETT